MTIASIVRDNMITNVVNDLLKVNNKVTTLEIKMECINIYPELYWKQVDIKTFVDKLVEDGELYVSDDNGTFRTYSAHPSIQVPQKMFTKSLVK